MPRGAGASTPSDSCESLSLHRRPRAREGDSFSLAVDSGTGGVSSDPGIMRLRLTRGTAAAGQREQPHHLDPFAERQHQRRSEEHTSELQSLMRISYAVFCLKKKKNTTKTISHRSIDNNHRTSRQQV